MEVTLKDKKQQQNQGRSCPQSTRQLLGIESITEAEAAPRYSLKTASSEAVFFSIKPSNISVMTEVRLSAIFYSLKSV